ncbi:MAG: hypothetical protein PWK00_05245, partial [Coxiella burnetii]|nr:hypothetical protein [Coxiella burnetii]
SWERAWGVPPTAKIPEKGALVGRGKASLGEAGKKRIPPEGKKLNALARDWACARVICPSRGGGLTTERA